jgi:hypothetical protein
MSAIASVPLEQRAGLLVGLGAIGLRTLVGRSYEACAPSATDAHIRG